MGQISVSPKDSDMPCVPSNEGIRGTSFFTFLPRKIEALQEYLRQRKVNKAIETLKTYGQRELFDLVKQEALEVGQIMSVQGAQKILDAEGINHCSQCTNRFGLRKLEGKYVCPKHFKPASMAVLVLLLLFPLVSCVPKTQIKNSYNEGYAAADKECLEIQKKAQAYIEDLKTRLARKNGADSMEDFCKAHPESFDCEKDWGGSWEK